MRESEGFWVLYRAGGGTRYPELGSRKPTCGSLRLAHVTGLRGFCSFETNRSIVEAFSEAWSRFSESTVAEGSVHCILMSPCHSDLGFLRHKRSQVAKPVSQDSTRTLPCSPQCIPCNSRTWMCFASWFHPPLSTETRTCAPAGPSVRRQEPASTSCGQLSIQS